MAFKPNDPNIKPGRTKGARNKATIRRDILAAIILDQSMPAAIRVKAATEFMELMK